MCYATTLFLAEDVTIRRLSPSLTWDEALLVVEALNNYYGKEVKLSLTWKGTATADKVHNLIYLPMKHVTLWLLFHEYAHMLSPSGEHCFSFMENYADIVINFWGEEVWLAFETSFELLKEVWFYGRKCGDGARPTVS